MLKLYLYYTKVYYFFTWELLCMNFGISSLLKWREGGVTSSCRVNGQKNSGQFPLNQ